MQGDPPRRQRSFSARGVVFLFVILALSAAANVFFIAKEIRSGGLSRFLLRHSVIAEKSDLNKLQLQLGMMYGGLPPTRGGVLFVGDSITFNAPYADLLSDIHNRGVSGDRSVDIVGRLPDLERNSSDVTVIQVGINDLLGGAGPAEISHNIETVVDHLRPKTKRLVLLGVYPVDSDFTPAPTVSNAQVESLNATVRQIGARPGVTYCDLGHLLANESGTLRDEMTIDGLHLSAKGYLALMPSLLAIMKRPGSDRAPAAGDAACR